MEHRDTDGNLTFPKPLIQSTFPRRYSEVEGREKLEAILLTGYKPHALMLIERKIYEILRLSVDGWRRRGQIHIEVDGWRGHESEWFAAMNGVGIEIRNSNLPEQTRSENYRVVKTRFEKKSVSTHHKDGTVRKVSMYGATLDIVETWGSTWNRHAAEIINGVLKYVVFPFSVAFGAGVAILWFQGSNSLEQGATVNTDDEAIMEQIDLTPSTDDQVGVDNPKVAEDADDVTDSDQAIPGLN